MSFGSRLASHCTWGCTHTPEDTIHVTDRHLRMFPGSVPPTTELHWDDFRLLDEDVRRARFIVYTDGQGKERYLKS